MCWCCVWGVWVDVCGCVCVGVCVCVCVCDVCVYAKGALACMPNGFTVSLSHTEGLMRESEGAEYGWGNTMLHPSSQPRHLCTVRERERETEREGEREKERE